MSSHPPALWAPIHFFMTQSKHISAEIFLESLELPIPFCVQHPHLQLIQDHTFIMTLISYFCIVNYKILYLHVNVYRHTDS